jgi:hypothetical protein
LQAGTSFWQHAVGFPACVIFEGMLEIKGSLIKTEYKNNHTRVGRSLLLLLLAFQCIWLKDQQVF